MNPILMIRSCAPPAECISACMAETPVLVQIKMKMGLWRGLTPMENGNSP